MPDFTIALTDIGKDSLGLVGGKGANLGELLRAGMPVPAGFCLSTRAFQRFLRTNDALDELYKRLDRIDINDQTAIAETAAEFRNQLRDLTMPDEVRAELVEVWRQTGGQHPYAVRSSATAEDLPDASFAGQHDTFLNVTSADQLIDTVQQCWISLFTDRAIAYRARHGYDHRRVELAVVIQRMVFPDVAGVLFTADPVTGHRHTTVINAAYGLGESVVSGRVNPDLYRITPDGAVHKSIADKRMATSPRDGGGVVEEEVPIQRRNTQALPDRQIAELTELGRLIAEHFGQPQDVEWALADDALYVLQARPITSLFPLPPAPTDRRLHVYFSFGHQQMMTDAMPPLAQSVLRTYFPFGRRLPGGESTQMVPAGGRLFFDYTDPLHTRLGRRLLAKAAGAMDRRVGEALIEVAARPEFQSHHTFRLRRTVAINAFIGRMLARMAVHLCLTRTEKMLARTESFLDELLTRSRANVEPFRGADRIERIQQDLRTFPLQMFFRVNLTQMTAMTARGLIERWSRRWLDGPIDLAALHKSLPGNVTTEMGLEIGDIADLARGNRELLAVLQAPPRPFTMRAFDGVPGGDEFATALGAFLDRYGVRGTGEIDITRTRWADDPTVLFGGIVSNASKGKAGAHRQRFAAGEAEAEQFIADLLGRLRAGSRGRTRAAVMSRLIRVYRTTLGLREHPKLQTVRQFDIYRRAIHAEAETLVKAGILSSPTDAYYLTLHELRQLLTGQVPAGLAEIIEQRSVQHLAHQALSPPRLSTSDGEVITGSHAGTAREGVLVGCPVSAGVVEGRARVVLRPQDARLEDGDILIAPATDPAWTPLFSAVRGIVLEIGGVMSHGAVIARELGLPTVVGIDNATTLIADGARIRVDGSQGYVETLAEAEAEAEAEAGAGAGAGAEAGAGAGVR